jgi:DNA-binding CsgD family transcriptional regulator
VGQQGRTGELQALTASALSIIDERSLESVRDHLVHAHALAALARGDAARAVVELEKLYDLLLGHGVRDPSVVPYAPDLIEAYARTRRHGRAQAALAAFTEEAERTQRSWALACVARCRGLLAADDQYAKHFDRALILHERTPMPFDRARTELCYGERLRRSRRRGDARRLLHQALATFEQLGAEPWAERAQAELAASGEIRTDRFAASAQTLSPQELQIAILIGKGATNKEIAATLFLSVKTIEFHLTNLYRRLDLRSRAQLAALIARSDPAPSAVATLAEE